MFKMLSLSTSWCGDKFTSANDMIKCVKEMGFNKMELNYSITEDWVNEIYPLVDKGHIEITSVHHPFPKVDGDLFGTDSMMLGFEDEQLRSKAVEITKKSIDHAHRLGAKAVVIHPSEVMIDYNNRHYDVMLKKLYRQGKKHTSEYQALFQEMMEHRNSQSHEFTTRTIRSLEALSDYICKKNYQVKLGIENRAMCHQIPDFYEAEHILNHLEDAPVYFWYDIGHGVMMENLGMFNNLDGIQKILSRTIGIHIHDVKGVDDHFSPYEHSEYMDVYLPIIKKIPIKVLEIASRHSSESVVNAAKRIETYLLDPRLL